MLKTAAAALLPLLLAAPLASPTAARTGPPEEHRIYPLEAGAARVPVPAGPGDQLWRVQDEAGRPVRDWAPADPDGAVRVPRGGWFRLLRRGAAARDEEQMVGGRFAAGLVVLVTGQSQADSFFRSDDPAVGAFPAGPGDPPLPPVAGWLRDCGAADAPGCGPDGTAWSAPGNALGGRVLLAELALRVGPVPLALANAAWGGASAAELAEPDAPAGRRLRRVARAAAPASAALVLAHGTTDALRGTTPEDYGAALARVVEALRAAGAEGAAVAPPVLLAPLPPLKGPTRLLGSGSLAALLLPTEGAAAWTLRAGIASTGPLPARVGAQAEAIRAAQARATAGLDLLPGGDMAGVAPGLDGVHWPRASVREAARRAAAALARALPPPP